MNEIKVLNITPELITKVDAFILCNYKKEYNEIIDKMVRELNVSQSEAKLLKDIRDKDIVDRYNSGRLMPYII